MRVSLWLGLAALAASAFMGSAPARADTAERCGWRGCSYIHCNWTGDRCYRIDEHGRYCGYYGEGCGYGDDGYNEGYRYRDDDDGDDHGSHDAYRDRDSGDRQYDDGRDWYGDDDDD